MKGELPDMVQPSQTPQQQMINKLPEITALFWAIKVLTTGMGEVFADFLAHLLTLATATGLGGIGLMAALALQLYARRYVPWLYWLTVVMVSIFGTLFADLLKDEWGISLAASTAGFIIAQVAVFAGWYAAEKNLSVHHINTYRREAFYWLTVLVTFALGTALGDFTAVILHWGFFWSGVLFALCIAIPYVGYRWFGMNEIFAFWFAYTLTRPLGASFSDWLWIPEAHGCLGLGSGPVSLALMFMIIVLVGYLTIKDKNETSRMQVQFSSLLQAPK